MGNQYGSLVLPVPVPDNGAAVSDPLLDKLLDFFGTVIQAECGDAWDAVSGNNGGQPLVKRVFAHDPGRQAFRPQTTPAIYLFRQTIGPGIWISHGIRKRASRLILRWIPFAANSQDRQRIWEPFFNAIPSALDVAVEHGRHPSWKVAGDTDENAEDLGSWLYSYIKVWQLKIAADEVQRFMMPIPMEGGSPAQEVPACDIPILLEEKLVEDPAEYDEIVHTQTTLVVPAEPPDLPDPLTVLDGRFNADPD